MSQRTKQDLTGIVLRCFAEIVEDQTSASPDTPAMDAALLESGLDSLGFDPVSDADEAYYARTVQQFLDVYHAPQPEG